jgi:hypothetical protein
VGCPEFGSVEDIITVGTEALLALLAVHSSGVLLVVVAEDLVSGSGSNGLRRGGLVAVLFEELDDLAQQAALYGSSGKVPNAPQDSIKCFHSAEQVFLIAEVAKRSDRSGTPGGNSGR